MRDAISGLIGRYDQLGRYFDRDAIDRLESYYTGATIRLTAVELINREAADIVREASQRLFKGDPELLLPGGNSYTTRRMAACLRDMDYFLRYASYSLVADDFTVLNERVLNGLEDTYNSLGVPTGPSVRSIILLADVVCEMLSQSGLIQDKNIFNTIRAPFEHIAQELAASDVRCR
uniref:Phycobilisome core component-allophycocyanin beta-18 subunit n=1 Tax=Paulinella chromatophora TaxID=39717 RepID=B1X429_PAUCH|nr:phycobilisome core component-allophycocyanin beta-18 subunit [Paulinella chromatophora]ACB42698.1 phycobilisome core component-allophycocyanin beta-18 subunit [Paulinella chromatophora]|eukprot:gb/GEZN01002749.1/.p2 GENE.gb/GEZN01002749.1/~~gb/GEZN01002749.1/.p2  ORF type:complete len:177 (-),score=2.92 gb/GEZN01002749.1/:42-572(-)